MQLTYVTPLKHVYSKTHLCRGNQKTLDYNKFVHTDSALGQISISVQSRFEFVNNSLH